MPETSRLLVSFSSINTGLARHMWLRQLKEADDGAYYRWWWGQGGLSLVTGARMEGRGWQEAL
jgi:hypothetical protein